jgi:hypothetical protein
MGETMERCLASEAVVIRVTRFTCSESFYALQRPLSGLVCNHDP